VPQLRFGLVNSAEDRELHSWQARVVVDFVAGESIEEAHNVERMLRPRALFGCARRLLARLLLSPLRGHTPSAPRYGLHGIGCLKQIPNAVFQQFDSPLQGAELSNPDYCDGQMQLK